MSELYYTAPSDDIFEEVKKEAMKIWAEYEDPYKSEKINTIKDLKNVSDNVMYIIAMFDWVNQHKLARRLSPETKEAIFDRLATGGASIMELEKWRM